MKNKGQEYEIDLVKLGRILWQKKRQVAVLCLVGSILGGGYPLMRPSYTSVAMLQVYKEVNVANLSDAINTSNSSNPNIPGIVEQLRTPIVIEAAVERMEPGDEQEKNILISTLMGGLKVENIRSTDLVRITAHGRTPEEANQFSQGVVDSFVDIHNRRKQELQKRKAGFLAKQVEEAEKAVAEVDEQLNAMPKNEVDKQYRQLEREVKIKEEIYASLVKEQESSKINEQFESEEIQVISPAKLLIEESGPRFKQKRYVPVGFATGLLLGVAYGLLCYRKEQLKER